LLLLTFIINSLFSYFILLIILFLFWFNFLFHCLNFAGP
jgi:hypothetical protein